MCFKWKIASFSNWKRKEKKDKHTRKRKTKHKANWSLMVPYFYHALQDHHIFIIRLRSVGQLHATSQGLVRAYLALAVSFVCTDFGRCLARPRHSQAFVPVLWQVLGSCSNVAYALLLTARWRWWGWWWGAVNIELSLPVRLSTRSWIFGAHLPAHCCHYLSNLGFMYGGHAGVAIIYTTSRIYFIIITFIIVIEVRFCLQNWPWYNKRF